MGRVNDGVFANLPGVSHRWAVDALGNFTSIKTDLDGDGDFTSGDASQTRTHNLQNELTQADGNHLSYDANGNLTVISTEADGGGTIVRRFTYDAWNRLVKVEIPAEQKVVTYTYNALHWRVGESVYLDGNLTTPVETHKFYYAPDWRLLEEETSVASGSDATTTWTTSSTQFYYGVRSLDDVLLVAHDANNDGDLDDAADCAWYQLTDSRFSPVLTIDAKTNPGRVLQQIVYCAYGKFAASTPADFNGDGFQDYTDFDDFSAAFAVGDPSADFSGDGFLEFTDFDDFVSAFEATHPAVAMLPPRIGFGGYQFDEHTGYLLARNRWYDPGLSRWLTRDPAGYVDGLNLYLYVRANPMSLVDPMGLIGRDTDYEAKDEMRAQQRAAKEAESRAHEQREFEQRENRHDAVMAAAGRKLDSGDISETQYKSTYFEGVAKDNADLHQAKEFEGIAQNLEDDLKAEVATTVVTAAVAGPLLKVAGKAVAPLVERGLQALSKGAAEAGISAGEAATAQVASVAQTGVQANRAAGNAFRDTVAAGLRADGREVATEVYKRTPFGKRFIDIEVSSGGKVLGGIETKVGSGRYNPVQRAKDAYLWHVQGYKVNVLRQP